MFFKDLRAYLEKLETEGEVARFDGVDADLDIGVVCELMAERKGPALLFDKFPGHSAGYRVAANLFITKRRFAILSGMPPDSHGIDIVKRWRGMKFTPVKPKEVKTGPIMENVHVGKDVNLLEFPVPRFHELDGGPYMGTGHVVIMKDPDDGHINVGTYRVQLHDDKTLGLYISPGKHNAMIRDKYHKKGLSCPVVIGFGPDPALFVSSTSPVPLGVSELDWAGWLKGEPIDIIKGQFTGLPLPANDEIVIEGECPPNETRMEGPFGEAPGYYASDARPEPIVKVKAIYHRNNPILAASQMLKPPLAVYGVRVDNLIPIWDALEAAGIPGIKGVWMLEAGGRGLFTVISLEQKYGGHAAQAGLVASGCRGGGYFGRYTIIVDDDIDPTDTDNVLWAVATRCDPDKGIDFIHNCWSTYLDPLVTPEQREKNDLTNTRVIINACRPFYWKDKFPKVCTSNAEARAKVLEKWGKQINSYKPK